MTAGTLHNVFTFRDKSHDIPHAPDGSPGAPPLWGANFMGFWRIFILGALMAARPMARKTEAFCGRCVDGPDDVVDVLLAVLGKIGLSPEVASEDAVGVLDGVALPG